MDDRTKNRSGLANMCPPSKWIPCEASNFIDELILDGWVPPERRWEEIAVFYKQRNQRALREVARLNAATNLLRNTDYAARWVDRWIASHDYLDRIDTYNEEAEQCSTTKK